MPESPRGAEHATAERGSAPTRSWRRTVLPRPMLIRKALGFMRRRRWRFINPSVAGVCAIVMITKSAQGRSASNVRGGEARPFPAQGWSGGRPLR